MSLFLVLVASVLLVCFSVVNTDQAMPPQVFCYKNLVPGYVS